ncbi:DUF262 domain-containing protein [Aeromonas caviae]|uniref:GmrSD restriction endonuclease domain-containing protein n=1 Tax=Aeromonas caviae TaxID=648 RepID=UPI0015DC12FB|nr:DUF262 domain-containing protein [Aeromonas caviae]BBS16560.1 hypothetical protein WP5W18E02_15970 [Aeromonas caviae]
MSTFDSTKVALPDMIRDITAGKVQLPDFQRGWVWDDSHVRSLLVSVARSFPVGAVMLLDTGGEVRFQVRPIENVDFPNGIPEPEKLILDGQQRLTSLTQVLALNKPVKTFDEKGKRIDRYYYIDIQKALEAEQLEDAIIAVEQSRQLKTNFGRDVALDLSTPQLECEQLHFPCNQILNSDAWEESLQEYAPQHFGTYMQFRKQVLNAFRSYQLPVIALGKTTSKEAVCLVFEKVNTGGVPLSVFELITATFAADNFNLRDDWYGSELRRVPGRRSRLLKEHLLKSIEPTDFLQAVSLLNSYERRQADIAAGKVGKSAAAVSAKRSALLSLKLVEYERWADTVEQGFKRAAQFLRKECFFNVRDLPYRTQIVPLAAVLAMLEERWLEPRIHDKLSQWFWCGVFGELYGGAVETRIANDLEDLLAWIGGKGEAPRTVYEAAFQSNRLLTLRSRLSAAYKGLNVLVQREGARDFFWKARIQELDLEEIALDIHHIFPKAWCDANGIKPATYNSVINKTAISYKANRMIGGKAPSSYLKSVQAHAQVQMGDNAMNAILESHFIAPQSMREDDFEQFFALRQQSLLAIVAQAMGKQADMTIAMTDGNEEDTDNEDLEVAE